MLSPGRASVLAAARASGIVLPEPPFACGRPNGEDEEGEEGEDEEDDDVWRRRLWRRASDQDNDRRNSNNADGPLSRVHVSVLEAVLARLDAPSKLCAACCCRRLRALLDEPHHWRVIALDERSGAGGGGGGGGGAGALATPTPTTAHALPPPPPPPPLLAPLSSSPFSATSPPPPATPPSSPPPPSSSRHPGGLDLARLLARSRGQVEALRLAGARAARQAESRARFRSGLRRGAAPPFTRGLRALALASLLGDSCRSLALDERASCLGGMTDDLARALACHCPRLESLEVAFGRYSPPAELFTDGGLAALALGLGLGGGGAGAGGAGVGAGGRVGGGGGSSGGGPSGGAGVGVPSGGVSGGVPSGGGSCGGAGVGGTAAGRRSCCPLSRLALVNCDRLSDRALYAAAAGWGATLRELEIGGYNEHFSDVGLGVLLEAAAAAGAAAGGGGGGGGGEGEGAGGSSRGLRVVRLGARLPKVTDASGRALALRCAASLEEAALSSAMSGATLAALAAGAGARGAGGRGGSGGGGGGTAPAAGDAGCPRLRRVDASACARIPGADDVARLVLACPRLEWVRLPAGSADAARAAAAAANDAAAASGAAAAAAAASAAAAATAAFSPAATSAAAAAVAAVLSVLPALEVVVVVEEEDEQQRQQQQQQQPPPARSSGSGGSGDAADEAAAPPAMSRSPSADAGPCWQAPAQPQQWRRPCRPSDIGAAAAAGAARTAAAPSSLSPPAPADAAARGGGGGGGSFARPAPDPRDLSRSPVFAFLTSEAGGWAGAGAAGAGGGGSSRDGGAQAGGRRVVRLVVASASGAPAVSGAPAYDASSF